MTSPTWKSSLGAALNVLASPDADQAHYLIRHGTMRVGIYAPSSPDNQTPHEQDELYIGAAGHAEIKKGNDRRGFGVGDVAFIEAGAAHCFENSSSDFATWVVFWGSHGGESS